jgi:hypothetical protein
MIFWIRQLLGLPLRSHDFTFMGEVYNGDVWEKIPDPSDAYPLYGMKQDMTVRRRR